MTGGYVLLQGPERIRKTGFLQICLYCAGFYTLVSLQTVILGPGYSTVYSLFLLPLLRVASIMVFAVLMTNIAYSYGWRRGLYVAGFVSLPFLINSVTFFFERHRPIIGFGIAISILVCSVAVWRYLKE
jgi:hypothetical protein